MSVAEDCLSPRGLFTAAHLCMDSNMVRAGFGSGLICSKGSNMHGLKSGSCRFWQRTDLPPVSNLLRRAAQTCSACKLAGAQIIPLPTLANQILARTFSDSVSHLFAYPAVGKFSRASSAGGLTPLVHCKEGREHCHSQHESRDRLL